MPRCQSHAPRSHYFIISRLVRGRSVLFCVGEGETGVVPLLGNLRTQRTGLHLGEGLLPQCCCRRWVGGAKHSHSYRYSGIPSCVRWFCALCCSVFCALCRFATFSDESDKYNGTCYLPLCSMTETTTTDTSWVQIRCRNHCCGVEPR